MFTGIIEALGLVSRLERINSEWRLEINTGSLNLDDVKIGDSISVNGCCLTVVSLGVSSFSADVSNETLSCTSLSTLKSGSPTNLEKAMAASGRFGGHIVSGHVDGVGTLYSQKEDGQSRRLVFEAPSEISRYIAGKGSICVDGVSLTVNAVMNNQFSINVIPHTQKETIIGSYVEGQKVNLEVDLFARYLERLLDETGRNGLEKTESKFSKEFLEVHGFD
jgi:riboflavin synthase